METTIHQHDTTGQAYDSCQTDELHMSGDLILVLEEKVVGVCGTWPVAVTAHNGDLHQVANWPLYIDEVHIDESPKVAEGVKAAANLATALGYELSPGLVDHLNPAGAPG
jgi:hypothetical protein